MKKFIYLLFLSLIFLRVDAQTWTTPSCNTNTTGSNSYGPMNSTSYENTNNRTAVILPSSIISPVGGKTISSLHFLRRTASGSLQGTPNFKIYLKEVSADDWGSGYIAWQSVIDNATLVYDNNPATAVGNTAGWKEFQLISPYTYSGTQNLAIIFEYSNTTASSNINWAYEFNSPCVSVSNMNTVKYSNALNTTLNPTLVNSTNKRPLIGFTFPENCPAPSDAIFTTLAANNVTFSWTENGSASNWEYIIQAPGNGIPSPSTSGTAATSNPTSASGLTAETDYQLYIRAICNATDKSFWSGPYTFTTPCASISTLPWTEGFENLNSTGSTYFPSCWLKETGSWQTQSSTTVTSSQSSGSKYLRIGSNTTNAFLWTVGFDLTAGTSYDFSTMVQGDNGNNWFVDYFVNTSQSSTGATQIGTTYSPYGNSLDYSVQGYTRYKATFTPTTTGTYYFGVRVNQSSSAPKHLSFDEFKLEVTPSCVEPETLVFTNITTDSATLAWNELGSSNDWTIEYGPKGFTIGSGTTVQVNTNPITTLSSVLTSNTIYDVYLKSNCGTESSTALGPIQFATNCAVNNAPYIYNVDSTMPTTYSFIGDCWETLPYGSTTQYRWNVYTTNQSTTGSTGPIAAYSGTNYFYTEATSGTNGAIAELITPEVNINSLTSPTLQFYYHMYGATIGELHIDIFNGTNWINDIDTIIGQQQIAETDPWALKIVDLSNYNGVIKIRFRALRGSSYTGDIAIDDIRFDETPTCFPPTNIVVSNITANTATVEWDDIPSVYDFQYVVQPQGTGTPTTTGIQTTDNPLYLSNLTSNTAYEVYVKSECSITNFSNWSLAVNFTTPCDAFSIPYSENFDNTTVGNQLNPNSPSCWYYIEANGPGSGYVYSSSNSSYMNSAPNSYLLMNASDLTGSYILASPNTQNLSNGLNSVSFYARGTFNNYVVEVGTMSDPLDVTTFTVISPITLTNAMALYTVNIPTGTDSHIAFKHGLGGSSRGIYIDDIQVVQTSNLSSDLFNEENIRVYPNPANAVLNIDFIENIDSVAIYNALGQQVLFSQVAHNNSTQVDISNLAQGAYIVEITSNDKKVSTKIIKQ
ncbi:T9SS type A sorting domain-containing protein [Flavobacterium chuncheonense]|uniref:T9SS type A sorting domain-containing protein n=1 Tax=Flavobacterium chuncheonense TaxID=2026653 RepID=A0ABW5YP46_9FLAO